MKPQKMINAAHLLLIKRFVISSFWYLSNKADVRGFVQFILDSLLNLYGISELPSE